VFADGLARLALVANAPASSAPTPQLHLEDSENRKAPSQTMSAVDSNGMLRTISVQNCTN
jgi:hypothetical protein